MTEPSIPAVEHVAENRPRSSAPAVRRRRPPSVQTTDILKVVLIAATAWVMLQLLWVTRDLLLVAFLGLLFGLAISAGVDQLQRLRIPRGVGAAIIVASFFGILVGFGAVVSPVLREQGAVLRTRLPEAVDRLEAWLTSHRGGFIANILEGPESAADSTTRDSSAHAATDASKVVPQRASQQRTPVVDTTEAPAPPQSPLRRRLTAQVQQMTHYLFSFLTSTVEVFAGLIVMLFISIYIAAEPQLYRTGILHLFPHHKREQVREVLAAVATVLRKWLVTQLIAMATMGVAATVVLLALGVKAAVALGVIAGLLEFVPTIGPILSAIPAVGMGFLDSPQKALYVLIAWTVMQQLEGHLMIPLLMKGEIDLPPVLTILAQAIMALIFGFLGLMVAVPLLAAIIVPIKLLYVRGVIGDDVELGLAEKKAIAGAT